MNKTMTEQEMRETKVETLADMSELVAYIESLTDREHDYGTCVYAMSMAATAAFNYVAKSLGVTGFQAGCADIDAFRRMRGIEGPFMVLQADNMLYPQYDLEGKLREFMRSSDTQEWLKGEAKLRLVDSEYAHPRVLAHWKKLAGEDE